MRGRKVEALEPQRRKKTMGNIVGRLLCLKTKHREPDIIQRKLGLNQHDAIDQQYSSDPESNTTTTNINPTFICDICVEPMSLKQAFNIKGCPHFYCRQCIVKFVMSKLEHNVTSIMCPVPGCKGVLDPEYCRSILPKKVFDRWGNALCEQAILGSNNHDKYLYCPYKDCSVLLIHDGPKSIERSLCPHCRRPFCTNCKVPWHMGFDCVQFQKQNKNCEEDMSDETVEKLAEEKKWRRCPNCKYYVEKSSGCNTMQCRCRTGFCYACGQVFNHCQCSWPRYVTLPLFVFNFALIFLLLVVFDF